MKNSFVLQKEDTAPNNKIKNILKTGVNPTKLFFRKTKFFSIFVGKLECFCIRTYCLYLKKAKLNSKNRKNYEIKAW
jgi:hypothetical protein